MEEKEQAAFVFAYDGKADKEAYYYLQKANVMSSTKARNTVLAGRAIFAVLGILLLRTAVNLLRVCLAQGFTDRAVVASLIVSAALSLSSFACAVFYLRRIASRAKHFADRRSGGAGELRFEQERIFSRDTVSSGEVPYRAVQSIYHKGNRWFLILGAKQALIADVSQLTEGAAEDFGPFLRGKTGKEAIEL